MLLPRDPWDWSVDQVSRKLSRVTNNHTVGELIRLSQINGECLLTELTRENLKDDVGIIALGTRVVVMRVVLEWRKSSAKYTQYRERVLAQECELRRAWLQERSGSLSPLPDLGDMWAAEEERSQFPPLYPN
ncbi:hypothetical protein L211DRAFT_452809 [Terfezia boudieri ATCC MYA-4762]|uniref:SAM domain-containing protein n=1 Tax=Terfezia boudieri ATCC MYA-4762 TaxID=1051890 RepID=A0A3N4LDZ3_9PEZI|nr:hypothetical protein L211DRAFT_452809 [Terfezia boudieri ATCC MYA-4762]